MYKIKRNGFTLVELMAVITIISLIALLTFPNIINQIKKTKKSNNKMIEDIVIEQAKKYVNDNDSEYTEDDEYCIPLTKLIDNDYIKEDLISINDIKDNKVIHLTRTEKDSYEIMDKDKCVIIPTAVKYLLKKTNPKTITNYTDGDIHEMYTFEHEATVQTPALTDYRYIGSDPNNYVKFNGDEIWRIIGVFSVEDENGNLEERVKLIRDESLGNKQWNSSNVNEWVNSTLQVYLNNTYTIDNTSRQMIDSAKWYLGGISKEKYSKDGSLYYIGERSEDVFSQDRSTSWVGLVGLMYPSDYIYIYSLGVDDMCYNTPVNCKTDLEGNPSSGWMYNPTIIKVRSTITSWTDYSYLLVDIGASGHIRRYMSASNTCFPFPVVYLNPNVRIKSGDGTIDNPYEFEL